MKNRPGIRIDFRQVLGNIALVILGTGTAVGSTELFLRALPDLMPREVRVSPPVRRVQANVDETFEIRLSDGDLFHWMAGKIAPLSPENDRVVARVHITTDSRGFRNPPPEKERYDIVALGDSFTRASGVAVPWPQVLAESAGIDVLNLGEVGAGPQQELDILQRYGLTTQPDWVILAYFEGNDLYDAGSYDQATPFLVARLGRYLVSQRISTWKPGQSEPAGATVTTGYPYPIEVTFENADLEMALFSSYISWLSVNTEMIEASQNFLSVRETILRIRDVSEAAGARFLLVYIPSKEHVYLPFFTSEDTLERVFTDVPMIGLDAGGYFQFTDARTTPQLTRLHMDDQAHLLARFASENNIVFLDLTPTFREEAGNGSELYYPFDTHWNQRGHELAAEAISSYLQK